MTAFLASTASTACSSSSGSGTASPGTDTGVAETGADSAAPEAGADSAAPAAAVAFFRGTLAKNVADSKAFSDPFFMGVQGQAMGAGDNGHDALLGTTDLGTTLNQFVGLDTWFSDANMDAVYADPHVQAFGTAFYAAPPEFKTFFLTDFHQWGSTDSADGMTPHYFVAIRGRYSSAPGSVKTIHDSFVQTAEAQYKTAGNVAHIVYSGRQDSLEALIVDVWSTRTNIESFYSDPQLKSAIGPLFDATGPNFGVYGTTDWVTW
jgi:quinol monooxygenase YgiN